MDAPRSNAPVVLALIGLGWFQQAIGLGVALAAERIGNAPGALVRPNAWVLWAAFVVFGGLLNGAFYNGVWLHFIGADRIRTRLQRVFALGGVLAVGCFAMADFLAVGIDRKTNYASWAQWALLLGTLVAGFRLSDMRGKG